MSRVKKYQQMYSAVLCDASSYTLVTITFDSVASLFILHACETIEATHGEFGSYFFINHTYFFKTITEYGIKNNVYIQSIALLFKEPFILQKPHPLIPSVFYQDYALTHPLLLQCAIIPPIHGFTVTALTDIEHAYQTAIAFTQHSYDEHTINRLFTKKSGTDFIPIQQHYTVIAACGSYLMEHI